MTDGFGPERPAAPDEQRRVALGVAHDGNRTVLRDWFDGEGFAVAPLASVSPGDDVDLCVVDPTGYETGRDQVESLVAADPAFLPVLLVASDERTTSNPDVWERVDDVLVTPLSPPELAGRTAALLDRRALSVDRARHRARLERQNDRLDEFAGVVSHDLRNPLNVARGNVTAARETSDSRALADAAAALDRMERLVGDVLALAREGAVVAEPAPFSLADAADAAWSAVAVQDATMTVVGDVTLQGDRNRVEQLLGNLFRNAVEHGSTGSQTESGDAVEHGSTGPPSQAQVDAVEHGSTDDEDPDQPTPAGDEARGESNADGVDVTVGPLEGGGFYVADDGPGVPADRREAVFESGHTTGRDGTGLGLAIVRTVAEAHGWTVRCVESESGGARFEVDTDG